MVVSELLSQAGAPDSLSANTFCLSFTTKSLLPENVACPWLLRKIDLSVKCLQLRELVYAGDTIPRQSFWPVPGASYYRLHANGIKHYFSRLKNAVASRLPFRVYTDQLIMSPLLYFREGSQTFCWWMRDVSNQKERFTCSCRICTHTHTHTCRLQKHFLFVLCRENYISDMVF